MKYQVEVFEKAAERSLLHGDGILHLKAKGKKYMRAYEDHSAAKAIDDFPMTAKQFCLVMCMFAAMAKHEML